MAATWRGHHAVPERRRPIRGGSTPRHRHRRRSRRSRGRSGRRRSALRRPGRHVRPDCERPHDRRLRHLLPPPFVDLRSRRRAGRRRRPTRSRWNDGHPFRRAAPPPLRRPRGRYSPCVSQPARLPTSAGADGKPSRDADSRSGACSCPVDSRPRPGASRAGAGSRSRTRPSAASGAGAPSRSALGAPSPPGAPSRPSWSSHSG